MTIFKQVVYTDVVPHNITGILAADIGGTNSNFGIFSYDASGIKLIFSLHMKSIEIVDFTQTVHDVVNYAKKQYGIIIECAVFAAAGVIWQSQDYVKLMNVDVTIDSQKIVSSVGLSCAIIVNDFEVIGYGLDLIESSKLVPVNAGKGHPHANKAILGAGTGLGKCIMHWDEHIGRHIPVASEGGHADFAAQNKLELELIKYVQHTERMSCNISWEDLLSGKGIQRIYGFFADREMQAAEHELFIRGCHQERLNPDEIFNSRFNDECSYNTFELFAKLYGRCAKNFALDALALGGVYIAGGIATKNVSLFQLKVFMQEFVNCGKQAELLKNVPIYVITDYNVSLYGAAQYLFLRQMCS